ncbi:BMP family lipoprotein [Cryobacterium tepidiphilum]|uniref:BMP family ABC transporter substrate-binding protein n=1 Tax=Cryobacterium tepidiphilum TaxID=2486026 RepID=A0A3M8KV94_9MICO|nr:BMP family ABC transporter substrate-binding protein [Cryobacterium tepidiphilum]RNE56382.1 BMP family ABC transporter substrate-binding protein [Cryobacterium tepidiphilum]
MRISTRKTTLGGLAALGVVALLAGCAPAPETGGASGGSSDSGKPAASDFLPCMVSDAGGFDDKSFNQLGLEGLTAAADKIGVKPITVQSSSDTDYAPNISNLVDQGCNLIVTVGFNLAAATKDAAAANPDVNFAIIDDSSIDAPNVKSLVFDTAQSAFLGGYAAASYSKTGVVGTFGGLPIPPVTIFMDGFVDGVKYFNEQKGKNVVVKGWDVASQNGTFTGGFEAGTDAKQAAQGLIDQNADVIMPVGGPIYKSAAEAVRDADKGIVLIGVDADVTQTDPDNADLFLTSVMKGIKPGVEDVTNAAAAGNFDKAPYVGTLENGGVALAPFHDYESKVDPGLAGELDKIKAGIIDGSIKVESPSSPK